MIAREDYVGPVTKAAEAMFARAERKVGARSPRAPRPPSALAELIQSLGLSTAIVRSWKDAGLVVFQRKGGHVVVDDSLREQLITILALRRAGLSVKQIAWLSDTLPPTVETMRQTLQARLSRQESERRRSILGAMVAGCSRD